MSYQAQILGEKIKQLSEQQDISVKQLSKIAKCSEENFKRVLKGRAILSFK